MKNSKKNDLARVSFYDFLHLSYNFLMHVAHTEFNNREESVSIFNNITMILCLFIETHI